MAMRTVGRLQLALNPARQYPRAGPANAPSPASNLALMGASVCLPGRRSPRAQALCWLLLALLAAQQCTAIRDFDTHAGKLHRPVRRWGRKGETVRRRPAQQPAASPCAPRAPARPPAPALHAPPPTRSPTQKEKEFSLDSMGRAAFDPEYAGRHDKEVRGHPVARGTKALLPPKADSKKCCAPGAFHGHQALHHLAGRWTRSS